MRMVLTMVVPACMCLLPMAWAQAPAGSPEDASPPAAVEAAPLPDGFEPPPASQQPEEAQPRGPYIWPEQAQTAPPAPESLVERAAAYYERLENAPPEVAAFLAEYPAVGLVMYIIRKLAKPLIFVCLLLLVGYGGRGLLRPLFGVRSPPDEQRRYSGETQPESAAWRPAAADLLAWTAALTIACEAVQLSWVGNLVSALLGLVGMLVNAVVWSVLVCTVAMLIAWSFSESGRRLILSLVGYLYLNRDPNRPPPGHRFALADGRQATIVRTDPLHSAMQPVGGGDIVLVPNADIMRQYYNWAAKAEKSAAGPA